MNFRLPFRRPAARPHRFILRLTRMRRGIHIRPTRYGFVFLGGILAMLFGAVNWNNNLSFLLTFLLTSLLLGSIPVTYRNLLPIEIHIQAPRPVFAGENALIGVRLHSVADGAAVALGFGETPPQLTEIKASKRVLVAVPYPAPQRGYLQPGPLTVSTTYPLGFFKAWRVVDHDVEMVVYPRPLKGEPPFRSADGAGDDRDSTRIAGGDDFGGLNRYQAGDPIHHIAWKAYSRGQGLYTKQFVSHRGRGVMLDWSLLGPLESEKRLGRLCAGVLVADRRGMTYGLQLPGVRLDPADGAAHRRRCLKALAIWGLPRRGQEGRNQRRRPHVT